MPIPLGILAAAGFVAPSGGSYDLLSTQILTSNQASVTFASLGTFAADYEHLQLRMTLRDAGANASWGIRFNGVTTTSYAAHALEGNGSAVSSYALTGQDNGFMGPGANSNTDANSFTAIVADILDPFSSQKNTTVRALNGTTGANFIGLYSTLFANTASVTSIAINSRFGTNILTGSRFSLYGLRKV